MKIVTAFIIIAALAFITPQAEAYVSYAGSSINPYYRTSLSYNASYIPRNLSSRVQYGSSRSSYTSSRFIGYNPSYRYGY